MLAMWALPGRRLIPTDRSRLVPVRKLATALVALVACATVVPGPASAVHPQASSVRAGSPLVLLGGVAVSRHDIWLVGDKERKETHVVARHWNGSDWEKTEPLDPCDNSGFSAVDASGTDDVWAAGNCAIRSRSVLGPGRESAEPTWTITAMIERWDGSSWSMVDVPALAGAIVTDIAVTAPDDIWISANVAFDGPGFLVHWDGSNWTSTDTIWPTIDTVTSAGGGEAWVTANGQLGHWTGSAWTMGSPAGGYMWDVDAIDSGDVWAVGNVLTYNHAARWDGAQWTTIDVPRGPAGRNKLLDVELLSHDDAWVVQRANRPAAPVLHWHHGTWTKLRMPADIRSGGISGIVATSARNAWTFGSSATGPNVAHWNGRYWRGFTLK